MFKDPVANCFILDTRFILFTKLSLIYKLVILWSEPEKNVDLFWKGNNATNFNFAMVEKCIWNKYTFILNSYLDSYLEYLFFKIEMDHIILITIYLLWVFLYDTIVTKI